MVASGLTLIFGVMEILNFAHGSFFMVGAYVTYTLIAGHNLPAWEFVLLLLAGALVTGAVGIVAERLVFRRLYGAPLTSALLGTYGLLLVLEGVAQVVWGLDPLAIPEPNSLIPMVTIGASQIPRYDLLVLGFGIIAVVGLWWLLEVHSFGRQIRAVAEDQFMASLLGVRSRRVYLLMMFFGTVLAGLGGGLAGPTMSLQPDMAMTFIIQAFAVVIIGGLGSVYGSLAAALILGVVNSLLVLWAPPLAQFTTYIVMIVVLLVRPQGLFGKQSLLTEDPVA